jgi:hypothetical protein
MDNTIFYVIGASAATRLAVAEEIAALTGAKVVDGQAVSAPIYNVIPHDHPADMPDAAWAEIDAVRDAILTTIETMSPKAWNFVFTHAGADVAADVEVYRGVRDMAARRGGRFQPARLVGAGKKPLLVFDEENALDVEMAAKAPRQVAEEIVAKAAV